MADALVLCYHAVSPSWDHAMAVRPAALHDQLQRLLRRGLTPTTFTELAERPDRRSFAVTFDDGFQSTFALGLPVLQALGVRATLFLPSALITRGEPLSWAGFDPGPTASADDLRPVGWDQVRELVDEGWEIGSHTLDHPRLSGLGDAELRRQLEGSRRECEDRLGTPCTALAYPFGDVDDRVQDAAGAAGYRWAAALGGHRSRRGPLALPRVGVYRRDGARRFSVKTSPTVRAAGVARAADVYRRWRPSCS